MINKEEIEKIFYNCFFSEEEIVNGRPTSEFTVVPTVLRNHSTSMICFSTNKLNQNKGKIITLLDKVQGLDSSMTLNEFFGDNLNDEWKESRETLHKLLLLASVCNIISINYIDDVAFVKRNHEFDNKLVKGANPMNLPEKKEREIAKGYSKENLEIIANNKKKITNYLNDFISIINTGLSFYNLSARINESQENQLDIYDAGGNLVYEKKYEDTDGIVGIQAILGQKLTFEYTDKSGNEITYINDKNRHIFLSTNKEMHIANRVEITQKTNENPESILVFSQIKDAEYIIKEIKLDTNKIKVSLNNQFGPYGNYEDGTERYLWFQNAINNDWLIYMNELAWYNKGHRLEGSTTFSNEVTLDNKTIINLYTDRDRQFFGEQIVAHPRNRELIEFTLQELDKIFPGISNYIKNNFPLYKYVTEEIKYVNDPLIEKVVDETTYQPCNLIKEKVNKLEKKHQIK